MPLVLVVVRDAALRISFEFAFEQEGFAAETFERLDPLVRRASEARADCLVVDGDGLEQEAPQLLVRLIELRLPLVLMPGGRFVLQPPILTKLPLLRVVEKPILGTGLTDAVRDLVRAGRAGGGAGPGGGSPST